MGIKVQWLSSADICFCSYDELIKRLGSRLFLSSSSAPSPSRLASLDPLSTSIKTTAARLLLTFPESVLIAPNRLFFSLLPGRRASRIANRRNPVAGSRSYQFVVEVFCSVRTCSFPTDKIASFEGTRRTDSRLCDRRRGAPFSRIICTIEST